MTAPWIVLQEEHRRRFGGDLRRAHILRPLAERTGAVTTGWTPALAGTALARHGRGGPPWARRPRPRLASVEMLEPRLLADVARRTRPTVLDVHDDPISQLRALGMATDPDRERELIERTTRNRDTFEILLSQTSAFSELAGLPADRTVIAPNGTDTTVIRPRPVPDRPAIGFASGAAPGRGIELLVDAARLVRERHPDTRLLLWLVPTGAASEAYLAELTGALAQESWVEIGAAPYDRMADELGRATVLAIPHPPGDYLDVVLPIKLADSMAAGRPVVVTPRVETARVIRETDCGLVAGDEAGSMAEAITELFDDRGRSARFGANGRQAAERLFDWRVIGGAVADAVLARVG